MALLTFLRQANKKIKAIFFHHGTETSSIAERFLKKYCEDQDINLTVGYIDGVKPKKDSHEEWWRKQRYGFFNSLPEVIATAHHLNDVAETYIWGCINGTPRFPYHKIENVVRPFLLVPKSKLISLCLDKNVPWVDDSSNNNMRFSRNRIRKNIIPEVLEINPGFLKVVGRLYTKNISLYP